MGVSTNVGHTVFTRILLFAKSTAKTVVNKGVVKPSAVAFSKCIMPMALNQQIIEIILIMLRPNCNLMLFDFKA